MLQRTAEVSQSVMTKTAEVSGKALRDADEMTGGKVTEVTEMAKKSFFSMASYGTSWFNSAS